LLADPSVLVPFILIGFAAQLVDGALGMAYGQISSTLLISLGVPPAAASAGVHTAETFTTAVSGISHTLHRNVDWKLFTRLVVPGVIGGVLGAYVLTRIDATTAKPFVLAYLTTLGGRRVIASLIGLVLPKIRTVPVVDFQISKMRSRGIALPSGSR